MITRAIGDLMLDQLLDLIDTLEKIKKKLKKAIMKESISHFYPSYVERIEAIIRELDELIKTISGSEEIRRGDKIEEEK
jgi:hypothetical protein